MHKKESPTRAAITVPKEGEVVLINDEKQPRLFWQIGRIQDLVKSSDGAIRSAMVRKANARIISRPINLLHPLELQ
jgi:hypothetical protein